MPESVPSTQLKVKLYNPRDRLGSYNDTVELEFEGTLIDAASVRFCEAGSLRSSSCDAAAAEVMKPTFNVFITMNPGKNQVPSRVCQHAFSAHIISHSM